MSFRDACKKLSSLGNHIQSQLEKGKKKKKLSSFSVDDKCSWDKCPNGKLCVLKDNGKQSECVDGKSYDYFDSN